jgi:hypothetical protein|tara:strand:- start:88 stop:252 length:165 start_codon:yes stop_codon:yes gene_type:complete
MGEKKVPLPTSCDGSDVERWFADISVYVICCIDRMLKIVEIVVASLQLIKNGRL